MKKIFITIPSGEYLVGFSSDLKSYLLSIQNNIEFEDFDAISPSSQFYQYANNIFHKGHKTEVHYKSVTIEENEKCFYPEKL